MNLWCIIKTIRVLRLVPKQLSLNGIYRVECLQQSNKYLLISNWFVLMNSYLACVFQMTTKKTYMTSRFTIKYPLFLMLFILTIGNPQLISWSWFMKLWPNNMTLERIQIKKKSFHTNNFKSLRLSKIKHSFLVAKKRPLRIYVVEMKHCLWIWHLILCAYSWLTLLSNFQLKSMSNNSVINV